MKNNFYIEYFISRSGELFFSGFFRLSHVKKIHLCVETKMSIDECDLFFNNSHTWSGMWMTENSFPSRLGPVVFKVCIDVYACNVCRVFLCVCVFLSALIAFSRATVRVRESSNNFTWFCRHKSHFNNSAADWNVLYNAMEAKNVMSRIQP